MKKNTFKYLLVMLLFIISINYVIADTKEEKINSPLYIATFGRSNYGGSNYNGSIYDDYDDYGYSGYSSGGYSSGGYNGFTSNGFTDSYYLLVRELRTSVNEIKSVISKTKSTAADAIESANQKIEDVDKSMQGFGDRVEASEKKEISRLEKSLKSAIDNVNVKELNNIDISELDKKLNEIEKLYERYSRYGNISSKEFTKKINEAFDEISDIYSKTSKINKSVNKVEQELQSLASKHAEIADRIVKAGLTVQEQLALNGKQEVATTYGTYDGYTNYLDYLEKKAKEEESGEDDEFICEGSVKTLKETSFYEPGLITATMPICERSKEFAYWQINGSDRMMTAYQDEQQWLDFEFIKSVGHIRQKIWTYRGDNKGYATQSEAPLCLEETAKGWGISQCEWRQWAAKECVPDSCCTTRSCSCGEGCVTSCCVSNSCCSKKCPDPDGGPPWKDAGNDYCYRNWTEPYETFYTYRTGGYNDDKEGPLNREQLLSLGLSPDAASGKVRSDGSKQCEEDLNTDWCNCLDTPKHPIVYAFLCPHYTCTLKPTTTGICTPSFEEKEGGADVYCINPSQPFTNTFRVEQDFTRDDNVNPKNCESSFASLDCGFANILIESEYFNRITVNRTTLDESGEPLPKPLIKKIPKKTIEFAMRLWSVHNGQQGFDKMGVSNRQMTDAGNCNNTVYYMKYDGDWVNVYKESHIYLFEKILERITDEKVTEINIANNDHINLFEYTCQENLIGVACEDNGSLVYSKHSKNYYKYAYALVANTILGNDNMQAHLNELFDDYDLTVRTVKLVRDITEDKTKNYQYVETVFEDLERILEKEHMENEKIYCTEENLVKYPYIKPFCQVELQIVGADGNPIQGGLMDKNLALSYCTKNYCRFKTVSFAICDLDLTKYAPIKVKVKRGGGNAIKSVKKYINCSNPIDNQIMYGFDDSGVRVGPDGEVITKYDVPEMVTDEFVLTDYKCQNRCDEYYPREDINQKCEDEFGEYDKVYSSSIKDPSLRCIMNMGDTNAKNMYNYSEEFGLIGTNNSKNLVNNKFCKIYCSDSVEFNIADKVRSKSGRPFEFNIESQVRDERSAKYEFSNIIRLKRTCVSEIYYDRAFTDAYDWKKIYDLGNTDMDKAVGRDDKLTKEEINGIANWKTLFEVLKKKAESEGYRNDNLNKLLYDLMNCNLYTNKQIEESVKLTDKEKEDGVKGVTRPHDDTVGNIRELILKHFTLENNYGIGTNNYGIKIKDGKYPDSEACNISYDGENGDSKGKLKEGGITGNTCVEMKTIDYNYGKNSHELTQVDMESQTSNRNNFSKFVYCTGKNCFNWENEMIDDKDHDPGENSEYNYPSSTDGNGEYVGNQTVEITYPVRDGKALSGGKIKTKDRTVEIPTNDYVMFEVQTDIAFYNNSRFEVDPLGESYEVTTTEKPDKESENLLLEAYLFPVSKNAYNFKECEYRDFLDPGHPEGAAAKDANYPIAKRCEINQNFAKMYTYFRKDPQDFFKTRIDNIREDGFTCYVDVERRAADEPGSDTRDSILYRNIDPAYVFPSGKDGYSEIFKSNWNTVLGRKVTDQIKESADELRGTENYLQYRITLTPYDILNIRDYNKNNDSYINEKQLSCQKLPYNCDNEEECLGAIDDKEEETDPNNTMQYDVFVNCKSPFLDELRKSDEYGKIDSEFNGLNIKKKDKD